MLEAKNVSKIFGKGVAKVIALNDVSLTLEQADFVAITGPSGSGKSTLLNVIGGLDRISSGEIFLGDLRMDRLSENDMVDIRRRHIAYVFQQYHLVASLTALENVLLPLTFSGSGHHKKQRALEMLGKVGVAHRAGHKPSELSGGEQQRVAIARALVNNCSLILADEPTGNLDQKTGGEILMLLESLNNDGYAIAMVTHSPDIAKRAKRILAMQDGQIINEQRRQ